jgi:hypothetical protein
MFEDFKVEEGFNRSGYVGRHFEIGAARNGLSSSITLDADNVR